MVRDKESVSKKSGTEKLLAKNWERNGFSMFAREEAEDRRMMRFSIWCAVAAHVLFLLINFPAFTAEPLADEPERKKVFKVREFKYEPPPPPPEEPVLVQRAKKQPVPDPTPEEPEPLRIEEPQPPIDLDYDTEIDFVIPDSPPPVDDEPSGPIIVGGDVVKPVKSYAPQPRYTEIGRKARIQGVVILQTIIDKQGNVTHVKVLKSLPMGLTEEAVKAVKTWTFKPATLNGKPVEVYYTLTINFQLQ